MEPRHAPRTPAGGEVGEQVININNVEIGSKWRNRKTGKVSEVVRIEGTRSTYFTVWFRQGKNGERGKFGPHLDLDYEKVEEAAK